MARWQPGKPSFGDIYPELVKQWSWLENPLLDPYLLKPASNQWAIWRCPEYGHMHRARVAEKARYPTCAVCAGKTVLAGFNDFASHYPELVKYWDDLLNPMTPSEVTWGSNQVVMWRCENGYSHSWAAPVKRFGTVNNRCHYYTKHKKKVLPGFNDIGTIAPQLLSEWDWDKNGGIDPYHTLAFPKEDCDWKCSLGHTWRAGAYQRAMHGSGCPICTGRSILPGFNDFATLYPKILLEWDYERNIVDPSTLSPGTVKKFWWVCQLKQHTWDALLSNRTKVDAGCPKCSNQISKEETKVFELVYQQFSVIRQNVALGVLGLFRRTMRVDMYLEIGIYKVVIEYDGSYYHALNPERDVVKTRALTSIGYTVIRLREDPLPSVEFAHENFVEINFPKGRVDLAAEYVITHLFEMQVPESFLQSEEKGVYISST